MDAENTAVLPFEQRFRTCFGNMLVCKTPANAKLFAELNLPSFIRDWLIMRFSDQNGAIDQKKLTAYIKKTMFSRLSQYGWLISGGSISRAKMFYDIAKRTNGLVSKYDYVALDEISSIKFTDKMEMQGALKGYLESGDYHVGDYRGVGEAGMVLLGNISSASMDTNLNMFEQLADFFRDSALLDRFHGFIKGWDIPKMHEGLKANGWALNTEYFVEILHALRTRSVYRSVVDRLIEVEPNAAVRDTGAIKRLATAYLKLLFPHVTEPDKIDPEEFRHYCLEPAMEMRGIIKTQLGIIDPGEFGGKTIPAVKLRAEV